METLDETQCEAVANSARSTAMDSQIHSENSRGESRKLTNASNHLKICDDKNAVATDVDNTTTEGFADNLRASLKELRKFREELDELGRKLIEAQTKFGKEVSTIKNSIKEVVPHEKPSENDANEQDLHLSEVKINKWTVAESNDSLVLERVKQICSGLDGDARYHYENIDDFDDTDEGNYQDPDKTSKDKQIKCKLFVDENGVFQPATFCRGKRKHGKQANQRRYFLGEIARGKNIIKCCQRRCTNYYEPWDVVRCVATKDAFLWYDTVALDPLNKKHSTKDSLKQKHLTSRKDTLEHDVDSNNSEARGLQSKNKWWQRKKKIPKVQDDSPQLTKSNPSNIDVEVDSEVRQYKYECDTCLEGFDEDPDEGSTACEHYNCKSCLKRYFEEQISNMLTKIECPRLDCSEEFSPKYIITLLSVDHGHRYIRVLKLKKELEMKAKEERCCQGGPYCTKEKCVCKNDRQDIESWIEKSKSFGLCPSCNILIEKMKDGSCNFVICSICGTEFCWICKKIGDEKFHLFECPLFGEKKFSKKRRIMNYIAFGVGVTIGTPLVSSIILGTTAVFMGSVLVAGVLSPPIYLAKDSHNYHKQQNSSVGIRRASTMAAGTLGVLGLPFLSLWGVYRTFKNAAKSSLDALDRYLDEAEIEEHRPVWTPPQGTQARRNTSKVSPQPTDSTSSN